jgi:WD40 repeat protein
MANSFNTVAISSSSPLLTLKSLVLNDGTFTISCLESIPIISSSESSSSSSSSNAFESNVCWLVSGDVSGGLRVWRVELLGPPPQEQQDDNNNNNNNNELVVQQQAYVRLSCPSSGNNVCSIVCMKSLHNGMLAVSTSTADNRGMTPVNDGARHLTVSRARAVHIISSLGTDGNGELPFCVLATIFGHQDPVQCLCELPNGDLLTAGGKMDATIKMWSQKQLYERSESIAPSNSISGETREHVLVDPAKTLPSSEAGYVFALQVLLDQKPGSMHFAVAAARYNVVKILL